MGSTTAIVDYGVGNLKSVTNAMAYLGLDTVITGDRQVLERPTPSSCPAWEPFPRGRQAARTRCG
jgi:glutamine amidotransferase